MSESSELKPHRLNHKTYLAMVQNAPGTEMFRHFYLRDPDGTEFDAIDDGQNACAFFASSVLVLFQKLKSVHGTVTSTVKDLEESGWHKVTEPAPGDVIVWAVAQHSDGPHAHIGFYLGHNRAVSTSSSQKRVAEHDLHFDAENRPVTAYYRHLDWTS